MLDKKEMVILSHLRKDARVTLTKMSKETQIPVSTLFDKLRLQEGEIIKGYTSILDFTKLGYNARANIVLKVNKNDRKILEEFLVKHNNVNSVYRINNGYDFLLEGIFIHIKETEDFIEEIENNFKIKSKQVYYIIEDLKREEFLSSPEIIDVVK